jgi:hypothetical protein
MLTTAPDRAAAPEPMSADMAAKVTAFARACKAAARTVALYPGEHPAVGTALAAVTAAAEDATSNSLLQLADHKPSTERLWTRRLLVSAT